MHFLTADKGFRQTCSRRHEGDISSSFNKLLLQNFTFMMAFQQVEIKFYTGIWIMRTTSVYCSYPKVRERQCLLWEPSMSNWQGWVTNIGMFHFYPHPFTRMATIQNLTLLLAPFEERNLKGRILVGNLSKNVRRIQIFKKNSELPLAKIRHPNGGGWGKNGMSI